ncbi:MAG: TetR/AcrR family transcriptional regulator [Atopobiaceae bacterium]
MARPRRGSGEPSPRDRLACAFWRQLGAMPFSEMTVRGIALEAGVNHNTFYRHFASIEDMARRLFDDSVFDALPAALLDADDADERVAAIMASNIASADMSKAALYARSGSELLVGLVRDALERAWLDAARIEEGALDEVQRVDLSIVFGGIVAAMADPRIEPSPEVFAGVVSRPLGRGMLETLAAMGATP